MIITFTENQIEIICLKRISLVFKTAELDVPRELKFGSPPLVGQRVSFWKENEIDQIWYDVTDACDTLNEDRTINTVSDYIQLMIDANKKSAAHFKDLIDDWRIPDLY
jgi:hypothetical protein